MHISVISVHQLALLSRFPVNWRGMYSMVFAAFFATGVRCLRSAPLEAVAYWPQAPINRAGSTRRSSGKVGGARGWVAGRAGFWGVLATWVRGRQLQPPGPLAPNLHVQLRH